MSVMGVRNEHFNVTTCDSFQAKIINNQLCYEVDLNNFSKIDNIEQEIKAGFIQGGPKKSGISKTMAITPLKSIRKGKSWCVLENSALMLQDNAIFTHFARGWPTSSLFFFVISALILKGLVPILQH